MKYVPDAKKLKHRLGWLRGDQRPHFLIQDEALSIVNAAPTLALAKAALFSGHTVIVSEPCSVLEPVGVHPSTAKTTWSGNNLKSKAAQIIADKTDDPLFQEFFTIVPKKITEGEEDWADEDNWLMPEYKDTFKLAEEYNNPSAISISFNDPELVQQWVELSSLSPFPLRTANIWLPELRGLTLETLLKLRIDENETFNRFHRAVNKIVSDLGEVESGTALKILLQETDYEVREYEKKLAAMKRRLKQSLAESAVGFSVVACCLLVPSEVTEMISAFIGTYQTKDFIQYLFKHQGQIADAKASDFYAAALAGKHAEESRK